MKLHAAAMDGNDKLVGRLLDEGWDPNQLDGHGRTTPLGAAASMGRLSTVRLLINRGADVSKGCPLYYAAEKGFSEAARMLLGAGADPNSCRIDGVPSPLLAAARGGHLDVVKLLVANGSDLGERGGVFSPLVAAAGNGHARVVTYLVGKGVDVDAASSAGWTALHIAADKGHVEVVAALLKAGADTNLRTKGGLSALQLAEAEGHEAAAAILRGNSERQEKSKAKGTR